MITSERAAKAIVWIWDIIAAIVKRKKADESEPVKGVGDSHELHIYKQIDSATTKYRVHGYGTCNQCNQYKPVAGYNNKLLCGECQEKNGG